MNSRLRKVVLTVRGEHGLVRRTYWKKAETESAAHGGTGSVHARPNLASRLELKSSPKPGATRQETGTKSVESTVKVAAQPSWFWTRKRTEQQAKHVEAAVKVVGTVHSYPKEMPPIKVSVTPLQRGLYGMYSWNARGDSKIAVSSHPTAAHPMMTTAHEMGHYTDHKMLGNGKNPVYHGAFGTLTPGQHQAISKAINESDAGKTLLTKLKRQPWHPYYRYLNDPREIYARAYAQWVAQRSGHPQMRAELNAMRAVDRKHNIPTQWEDKDFRPIAAAFDAEFGRRGLLHAARAT